MAVPSSTDPTDHQKTFKTAWHVGPLLAFRIFGFTICVRPTLPGFLLAAPTTCGSPNCCVRGDAKVFKKYSQMKLAMKREALQKLNRPANEQG